VKTTQYAINDTVKATIHLYEIHPDGRPQCVAKPGDVGYVEYVNPRTGVPLVRFSRSGWALDCNDWELEVIGNE
jgi:hypothetical protein